MRWVIRKHGSATNFAVVGESGIIEAWAWIGNASIFESAESAEKCLADTVFDIKTNGRSAATPEFYRRTEADFEVRVINIY